VTKKKKNQLGTTQIQMDDVVEEEGTFG